jgi:peptidoglycan/LPS O-acetylase OafA/YrhL
LALETTITPPSASDGRFLATLDGWRAVAIILVLLDHDKIYRLAGFSNVWLHDNGGMGVDVFFALSGLLICTRLLMEERQTGSISLKKFYIRRFFRIQPAALVYLAAVSLMMLKGVLYRAYGGVFAALLLVRNYFPLHSYRVDWYTAHFWSLSVEEHFYLLLPASLLIFKQHRLKFLLGLAVVLRVWQAVVHRHASLQFGWDPQYHTDVALPGILLAASMAVLLARPRVAEWSEKWLNPYVIIPLTMVFCYLVTRSFNPIFEVSRICLLPILVVSTMLHPKTLVSRFLDLAPLRFIGRISYSVYLWQMLFFVARMPLPSPHSDVLGRIQESWMRFPATIIAALASYYFVEKPLIKVGHKLASYKSKTKLPINSVNILTYDQAARSSSLIDTRWAYSKVQVQETKDVDVPVTQTP